MISEREAYYLLDGKKDASRSAVSQAMKSHREEGLSYTVIGKRRKYFKEEIDNYIKSKKSGSRN